MKPKRVTVKDIANLARVSRGTVDRVLHNRGRVAEDVRVRVEEAIKVLEYKPNLVARSLASQKDYTIATLLPNPTEDPFWNKPQKGIKAAHQEVVDYGIQINQFYFSLFDSESFRQSAQILLESNPDAILIATEFYSQAESFFRIAEERNIPVICINTLITEFPNMGYIGQDSFQSGVLAGKLIDITIPSLHGIVTLNVGSRSVEKKHLGDKSEGLASYFEQKNKQVQISGIDIIEYMDQDGLKEELKTALEQLSFQAILITNSRAYHLMPALKELGYADCCIIGYDLLDQNKAYLKAGDIDFIINQDPIKQGKLGIKTLFRYLLKKEVPEQLQYLPLDIVVKENCEFYN